MSDTPLSRYHALVASGALTADPAQENAAREFDTLHKALAETAPPGFLARIFQVAPSAPGGLYLHGAVGRGKSLLMDMFFADAPGRKKLRLHFNAFMMQTHARIHEWRNLSAAERARRAEFVKGAGDDPIAPVARRIANDARLLCLDEFQVQDVADAMILGRLFEHLFKFGVTIVVTSNSAPDRLYLGGLNRQIFLPFIDMLKARLKIVPLDGNRDYRLNRVAGVSLYNTPLGEEADAAMNAAWERLTLGETPAPRQLPLLGRMIDVPRTANGVARFEFADLCGKNLGAVDYVTIASAFHTLMLDNIPVMTEDQFNEARRLTLLIDSLYDERVTFICSAEAEPDRLFHSNDERMAWFARTASRLMEIQSADYLRL